jgi:anti-sigma factor RsiW
VNCELARKLLPLHAGGDLPEKDSLVVAEHAAQCPDCRALSEDLSRSLAWLRSTGAPSVSESDYTEVRRSVWRRIEEGKPELPGFFPDRSRLLVAGAALFAAVLAGLLLVRRPPDKTITARREPSPAPSTPLSVSAPDAPLAKPSPVQVAAASPPSRVRHHRSVRGEPSGVDRIEFRTANPNVRIIWLVRKGGEKSSSLPAGRNQEVS